MKLKELPQIMALSTAEKLELIDDLWISIEPELQQVEVSEEEKNFSMTAGKNSWLILIRP